MTRLQPGPDHTTHDRLIVAAAAAGDLGPRDRALAAALLAACRDCATLASELSAIAAGVAALPRPRPDHDYLVGPTDGHGGYPGAGWVASARAVLASFRTAVAGHVARPLATTLVALGLTGSLVTGVPNPAADGPGPSTGIDSEAGLAGWPAVVPGRDPGSLAPKDDPSVLMLEDESGAATLAVLSGSFLIAGLGLLGLHWTGRRFGSG